MVICCIVVGLNIGGVIVFSMFCMGVIGLKVNVDINVVVFGCDNVDGNYLFLVMV